MGKSKTKAELQTEFELLREKTLVQSKCRFFFHDYWGSQRDFHYSPSQIRLITGGNRTGKSTCGAIEVISWAMGVRPDGSKEGLKVPPCDIIVLVKDRRKSADKTIMTKLRHFCPDEWITKVKPGSDGLPEWVHFVNGSRVYIGSHNIEPSALEGQEWHGAWFDEPPPRTHWIAIRRGLLDFRGRAIFTLTPLSCPWIKREIHDRADGKRISTFNLDLDESPFFDKDQIDEFKADLDPDEIEARIHGRFSHLEGQIFRTFRRDKHVIPQMAIPWEWPRFVVMDPHNRRPAYIMWATVNPMGQIIIYDEWPDRIFYDMKRCDMSVKDYVAKMVLKNGPHKPYEYIIDPNFGKTPSIMTGRTLIEEFLEYGIDFYADINNDIALGHNRINERLRCDIGEPMLLVTENCTNMVVAFENYIWDEKSMGDKYSAREIPAEYGKDMIDTVRYLLDYEPRYVGGANHGSPVDVPEDRGICGYG